MIHICFNLDEKYIFPCKVLIQSIIKHTKEQITFHFIGIPETDMNTNMKCIFYPNPDLSWFTPDNLKDYYYFSQAAMYRLLIPFLIKEDKVLYMDIDMLVRDDIKELYDTEVKYVGAVIDPCEQLHYNRLKLDSSHYYNSGLILFNSKNIRKDYPNYKELILNAQKDYVLDLKDQDIFNIVFQQDKITTLDYKWNIDSYNLKEKGESKETSTAKDKAYKNPSIVHCMGKNKWWNLEGMCFGDEWDSNNTFKTLFRNKRQVICGVEVITNW